MSTVTKAVIHATTLTALFLLLFQPLFEFKTHQDGVVCADGVGRDKLTIRDVFQNATTKEPLSDEALKALLINNDITNEEYDTENANMVPMYACLTGNVENQTTAVAGLTTLMSTLHNAFQGNSNKYPTAAQDAIFNTLVEKRFHATCSTDNLRYITMVSAMAAMPGANEDSDFVLNEHCFIDGSGVRNRTDGGMHTIKSGGLFFENDGKCGTNATGMAHINTYDSCVIKDVAHSEYADVAILVIVSVTFYVVYAVFSFLQAKDANTLSLLGIVTLVVVVATAAVTSDRLAMGGTVGNDEFLGSLVNMFLQSSITWPGFSANVLFQQWLGQPEMFGHLIEDFSTDFNFVGILTVDQSSVTPVAIVAVSLLWGGILANVADISYELSNKAFYKPLFQ